MAKEKAGNGECDCCGEKIVWKWGEKSRTLTYTCQECDYRGYAPAGTKSASMIEIGLAPIPGKPALNEGAPTVPKREPEAQQAAPKNKKRFSLEGVY